jgi:hypothetical protein
MSTQSSAPSNARIVYPLLILLGGIAAALGASTIGWISYSYLTREELRNPVPLEEHHDGGHGSLPGWIVGI